MIALDPSRREGDFRFDFLATSFIPTDVSSGTGLSVTDGT